METENDMYHVHFKGLSIIIITIESNCENGIGIERE